LRQYSIAREKALALEWDEAKVYYENALRIDPNFTSAALPWACCTWKAPRTACLI